jgi:hypothetical protein
LIAIQLEEKDLLDTLGKDYAEYRERVPMLLPTMSGYETPAPKGRLSRIA